MADKPKKPSIAKKILSRKKDPELQKQLASEQLSFDEPKEEKVDEVADIVKKSDLQTSTLKERKKKFRLAMILIFVPLLGYGVHLGLKPFETDIRFGFCRVYLELSVEYPDLLELSELEERTNFMRIWYMQTDSFGQERMDNIECYHGYDDVRGYFISKIRINRRDVDPAKVELFNKSLPTIVAYPPELTYPRRLRDALGNIDIQTYLFRKPIL